jgi:hypothetical protein
MRSASAFAPALALAFIAGCGNSASNGGGVGPGGSDGGADTSTGGTSSTRGTGGGGGSSATGGGGSGGGDKHPPQKIGKCDALAPKGKWEQITPPDVVTGLANMMPSDAAGTFAFAVDPVNSGTVYLGTVYQKAWKSIDCGSTWTELATGMNANYFDHAMNWTFAVDPVEPNVVYTNTGYGTVGSSLLKSTNGGKDWSVFWPPASQPDLSAHFTYNFANIITLDPNDHQHLVLTFHESCMGLSSPVCIAETKDGGGTWRLVTGEPTWNGGEGQLFYFLDNDHTWIWGSQSNGFYRTEDSGATWTQLLDNMGKSFTTSHLQGAGLYRSKKGVTYLAAADNFMRSVDTLTWTALPMTNPIGGGITSDGTTMYLSRCFFGDFCAADAQVFMSSPEDDGVTWSFINGAPTIGRGAEMHYDTGHHLLFSSAGDQGFWRVVTE